MRLCCIALKYCIFVFELLLQYMHVMQFRYRSNEAAVIHYSLHVSLGSPSAATGLVVHICGYLPRHAADLLAWSVQIVCCIFQSTGTALARLCSSSLQITCPLTFC